MVSELFIVNDLAIKLGDLDPVDLKSCVFAVPGRVPLALSVVESVRGMGVLVGPGLAANAVGEVAVGATDCQVKKNVIFSIEGSSVVFSNPGVVKVLGELASLEEAL